MRWLKRLLCLIRGHVPVYRLNKRTGLIEIYCKLCNQELRQDFKGHFW